MNEKDKLLDSNYDGIQEYDNDLPRWWLNIFWLTTLFAVVYAIYIHAIREEDDYQQLANAVNYIEEKAKAAQQSPESSDLTEDDLLALVNNQEITAHGKVLFTEKCSPCHGPAGEGLIGPNLADNYWIHGGKLVEIQKVITKGVPEKGMLSWESMLSGQEIQSLVAYIATLKGTNPPNAKAPQGDLVE